MKKYWVYWVSPSGVGNAHKEVKARDGEHAKQTFIKDRKMNTQQYNILLGRGWKLKCELC